MKRIIACLLIIISQHTYSQPVPGSVIGERLLANDIIRYRLQFVQDKTSYINGGLTFAFPFTFSNNPRVLVSVEGIFDPLTTYTTVIESISTTNVTVRVSKIVYDGITTTTVAEAGTGEVIVTMLAIEDYPF